jgi:hypothetical protein
MTAPDGSFREVRDHGVTTKSSRRTTGCRVSLAPAGGLVEAVPITTSRTESNRSAVGVARRARGEPVGDGGHARLKLCGGRGRWPRGAAGGKPPHPGTTARGPQAGDEDVSICLAPPPEVTSTLRGLACSATGMVTVSTPLS